MSRSNTPVAIAALVLAAWLGTSLFFSAIVAPAAFRALPDVSMAGALVRATLPAVFYWGMIAGLIALWLGGTSAADRGRLARNLCSAGVVVCCAVGQFVAVQRIDRLSARLAAPIESLAPTDPSRLTFDRLHSLSVGALGVAMLLALASIVLLWRAGLASTVSPE